MNFLNKQTLSQILHILHANNFWYSYESLPPPSLAFFKKYVDDCIGADPLYEIHNILKLSPPPHARIQFTLELETNSTPNVIDLIPTKI